MKILITTCILSFCFFTMAAQDKAGIDFIRTRTDTNTLKSLSAKWRARTDSAKSAAVEYAAEQDWIIRRDLPGGKTIEIKELDKKRKPVYYTTDNLNASSTTGTRKLWPGGTLGLNLTGSGMILREWDGGKVRTTHNEINGRVTQSDGATTLSDHSTHVAGTMIATGVTPAAKGMSYEASLRSFDWNSDFSEMATEAASGALLSNHSYGYITGWSYGNPNAGYWGWFGDISISPVEDYSFGFYDPDAQAVDQIAVNAPYYLICKSAGNDRSEGPSPGTNHYYYNGSSWILSTTTRNYDGNSDGYDCISSWGLAKNILTVGAVHDVAGGYGSPSDVVLDYFSGTGPADDGRIKPDIVADGDYLYSSLSSSNSAYGTYSGTSMASPNACGSLMLLQQYYYLLKSEYMKSSTLKALVIATADEAGAYPGPDYMYGWGLLDMEKAATVIRQEGTSSWINQQTLLNGGTWNFNVMTTGNEPLKVTICWTDPAGTPVSASLDPTNKMLVNDLDLRVDGSEMPWILSRSNPSGAATTGDNTTDNVEQVYIASPSTGTHTITVTHKGLLSGGSQDFSAIITGVFAAIPEPLPFTAHATGSSEVSLSWTPYTDVLLAWSSNGTFGTPVYGTPYVPGNTIAGGGTVIYSGNANSFIHSNLPPATEYYYRIWSINNAVSAGVNAFAKTLCTSTNTFPINETFSTGVFPCGWSQQVNGIGNFADWSVSNSAIAGGTAYEMKATKISSDVGSGYTTRLICMPFNSTGMTIVNLNFVHMFDDFAPGATIKIQSSSDKLNWTDEGWSYNSGSGNIAATTVSTNITHNLDQPDTWIAFVITGNLNKYDYWYIDDVSVKAPGYWIGGTTGNLSDWNTATNWGDQMVPTALVNVYVPLRTFLPVVNNDPVTPAHCKNLVLGGNTTISIQPGKVLNVGGDMIIKP